jgi:hypothetical protein
MAMTLDGSNGVTFNDASLQGAAASPYVLKNRIINGDMRIDQRNAGAEVNPAVNATYYLDRWRFNGTQASKLKIGQNAGSVTPPAGFTNYLGLTSLSAYSITSSDFFFLLQFIEGFNTADLAWGTANAKTVTLSFWVRSSLTGTFGVTLINGSDNRSYPATYTISSANTWTQISITIPGDTSGTWATGNTSGIAVIFGLGIGSTYSATAGSWTGTTAVYGATGATSVVGTNGATFYITGVQLEQNTSATPFERRLYNQELANCQRYYTTINDFYYRGYIQNTAVGGTTCFLPVKMRASPTITKVGTWTTANCAQPTVGSSSGDASQSFYIAATWTATGDGYYTTTSTSQYLTALAEL